MLNDDEYIADYKEWDDLAESYGIHFDTPGWMVKAREAGLPPRPMGPSKKASPRCQSGKHNYCTCDTCF